MQIKKAVITAAGKNQRTLPLQTLVDRDGVTKTALTIIITAFVSNAAAIALLLPICLTVANEVGINPRAIAILLPVAAGLDFSLPVSTPAMAMVFGTGYLRTQDSVIPGIVTSIVSTTLTLFFAWLVWPWLGIGLVGE